MKALVLSSYGPDAPFELVEMPDPVATSGHVVIKVAAVSVNTVDTMIRSMGADLPLSPQLPAVLGMDFAGTVIAIGDGVTGFAVGDEVYGCAGGLMDLPGSLAEYINADARLIAHKPKSLTMREAAALPLVGITAYEGLSRTGVGEGQTVLVHGGAGGVGHVAVQIARHLGATVSATGRGADHMALIEGLGARAVDFTTEKVEDYVAEHTGGIGFDVVFDSVGGPNMTNSFNAAKLNGHVASTVAMVEIDLTPVHFKGLSLHVVFMLLPMMHDVGRQTHGDILKSLADLADTGALKPIVDEQLFGWTDVGAAYAHLTNGTAVGKVVVEL
ncbi:MULTISPECIES: zinc-dependent alcohol dehydrogenase family protein [unclassified Ruegeria]|uniref:zinc-dependent alcohol dehydrogenase family protein n=1 Tax=unclassified Ruegeria TaxID=2625375 RepID=UPI0014876B24|nr:MULTISPECIES: zinc-dependent alcohol dehydrogenase family protein [unclassified Ruegeria]NOD77602.1 zinc-binding dehydrogenase [Ruegeria sp. HKCCD4332]NOD89806.1 zinc-binding dehydrogenase [Ruegeria sp. HKCCD4318]NOE14748.1 zinc-binding dehydrogenase [Ruegeria sp. HKCCD4318-2]NOG10899.1 zinc-dependent alcohol dehydrogenase family protein [Ruegeria sp. HKCCD4315]